MITDKQIEEAATMASIRDTETFDCNKKGYVVSARADHENGYREGYIEGAHWAIKELLKELWHDAKEEPKKNKQCLIEIIYPRPCGLPDDIDYTTSYFSDYGWNEYNFRFTHYAVSRWLYIDDLTKNGGEK